MKNIKIEIHKSPSNQWFWRIVASNGRILCHSEQYKRKAGAINALLLLDEKLDTAEITLTDKKGTHHIGRFADGTYWQV